MIFLIFLKVILSFLDFLDFLKWAGVMTMDVVSMKKSMQLKINIVHMVQNNYYCISESQGSPFILHLSS